MQIRAMRTVRVMRNSIGQAAAVVKAPGSKSGYGGGAQVSEGSKHDAVRRA